MTAPTTYRAVQGRAEALFTDRGSKFIGIVFGVRNAEEAKTCLQLAKKEHPKASHHCFGWRLGDKGEDHRVSDAGEPSGSAGRPILGQIDSKGLTYTLVVVVRYFGGTLLGVPGLINAYKTAAALALQLVPTVEKDIEESWVLQYDYTLMNEVMRVLKRHRCTLVSQEQQLFCRVTTGIPLKELTVCLEALGNIHGLELERAS
jgi:uncharacterized YigZ family protein